MPSKIVIALVLAPALFLGLLLSADYAIVDIRDGGPGGTRVVVPVPLTLARLALGFAPEEAQYVPIPEVAAYLPHAERLVTELRAARDGVLVSVQDRRDTVLIEKVGDTLEVHVADGSSTVDVTVPLDAVIDALRAYDGEGFDTRDLIRAAGRARGNVVHVKDGRQEVNVWVW